MATAAVGLLALFFAFVAIKELGEVRERVELVYKFDLPSGQGADVALDRARKVLAARLKAVRASRIQSVVELGSQIRLTFRIPVPATSDETARKREEDLGIERARMALEQGGYLQFLVCAAPDDVERLGGKLEEESERADRWRREHAGGRIEEFNSTPREAGGTLPGLRWLPTRSSTGKEEKGSTLMPLLVPDPKWRFSGADLESIDPDTDGLGNPAIHFELVEARQGEFGDFTESLTGRQLAIVVSGRVMTAPRVRSRLPGSGIIEGGAKGFTRAEVQELVALLRSGELPSNPVLVSSKGSRPVRDPFALILSWGLTAAASFATLALLFVLWLSFRDPRRSIESDWSDRRS